MTPSVFSNGQQMTNNAFNQPSVMLNDAAQLSLKQDESSKGVSNGPAGSEYPPSSIPRGASQKNKNVSQTANNINVRSLNQNRQLNVNLNQPVGINGTQIESEIPGNFMQNEFQKQLASNQQIRDDVQKPQSLFSVYSKLHQSEFQDAANITGTTAATRGNKSQNKNINLQKNELTVRASGHFGRPLEVKKVDEGQVSYNNTFQNQMNNQRQGPVKATRAALGNQQISLNVNQVTSKNTQLQQDLVIDSRREKNGIQNKNGLPPQASAHNKSSKSQQKGIILSNRMKNQNANDLVSSLQAKSLESERSQAMNYEQFESDAANNMIQGTAFQRAVSHDHQSKLLTSYIDQDKEPRTPISAGGFGDQEMRVIGATHESQSQQIDDPALITQSSKIQYIAFENVEQLDNPEKQFKKSISKGQGIHSQDWTVQFEACNVIRQVCKHHQSLILGTINQLQNLVGTLIKLAESLRSAVCRISLITINEMFIGLKRVMEPCLDPIIKILLKKGADTNHFIAHSADKCLNSLVQNCQEQKVLQILQLQNMTSKNNNYRLKVCECLQNIARQLGNNILFFKDNDKLLSLLANYLFDASQEVRKAAKNAFISMSQQIMGQNELEKLLQRVLKENQYKKVKEFLDKEPVQSINNQVSQNDFVITNAASNSNQIPQNKKTQYNKAQQQSLKNLRFGNINQKNTEGRDQKDGECLNIKAKQILHPNAHQSTENQQSDQTHQPIKIQVQQLKQQPIKVGINQLEPSSLIIKNAINSRSRELDSDANSMASYQFFSEQLKEHILKTQMNEWRSRYESAELLFEFIKNNQRLINQKKPSEMLELVDSLCKLINDSNAKIQLSTLQNLQLMFEKQQKLLLGNVQLLYRALLSNLGTTNVGVRKLSESLLNEYNLNYTDKNTLLQLQVTIIQSSNNVKIKIGVIDQILNIIDLEASKQNQNSKSSEQQQNEFNRKLLQQVTPLVLKIFEDNKPEVKQRSEKLLKQIFILNGAQLFDICPKSKLNKVKDLCLGSQTVKSKSQSLNQQSQTNQNMQNQQSKQEFSTGTFGANGSQVILNTRT